MLSTQYRLAVIASTAICSGARRTEHRARIERRRETTMAYHNLVDLSIPLSIELIGHEPS